MITEHPCADRRPLHIKVLARIATCGLLLPLLLGADDCNKPVVRVWSDVNGGGSPRNIPIDAVLSDLRNDRYDVSVGPTFMDDNISAVANFSDKWAKFGSDQQGWAGSGVVACFPPHRYITDLTHVDAAVMNCSIEGVFGACGFFPGQVNLNDSFSSYLGSFAGSEGDAIAHSGCTVVVRGGNPL